MMSLNKVTPLSAPSLEQQIERLNQLKNASHIARLLQGAHGFDEQTHRQKLNANMKVIAAAWREAVDEMGRCSRESEGAVEPDPWFRLLHHQALIATEWVASEASKQAYSKIWMATFNRPMTKMLAIGSNELHEPLGDAVYCPHCGQQHPIEYGEEVMMNGTRKPSKLLSFYRCGDKLYLAGMVVSQFEISAG